MVEGKTGLNIKDFPFAFSIAALTFPNILSGDVNQAQVLGILLIGGMLGSLLTIINPIGFIIKEKYKRSYSDYIDYILFPDFLQANELIKKIIQKNFKASLSSPAISFENDKIVAMIYFIIILSATLGRSFMSDFQNILNNNEILIWSIRALAIAGLVGVVTVLLNHTYGINFRRTKMMLKKKVILKIFQQPNLSQFDRICCATVANLALDFANLSNEGDKWKNRVTNHPAIRSEVLKRFLKIDKKVEVVLSHGWTTNFDDFKSKLPDEDIKKWYQIKNVSWDGTTNHEDLYQKYKIVKEISLTYGAGFAQTLTWFESLVFFNPTELYELEQLLKSSIESRDWYSAYLMKYRITDRIDTVLRQKNMPNQIDDS